MPLSSSVLLIGNPVSHSLSPFMHNAAFEALRLPYSYTTQLLQVDELKPFFKQLPETLVGLNVTVPYKQAVIDYLDELDSQAALIGAVNTIVLSSNRKLKGYNTDALGYLRSLQEETNFECVHKKIIILGAGGAARAIVAGLCQQSVQKIILLNRTVEKAQALAQTFQAHFPQTQFVIDSLESQQLPQWFSEADLVINTTSVELKGKAQTLPPLPLQKLPVEAIVSDIIYTPEVTPLLAQALQKNLKIHKGLGMLLHQGVLAFELWTGQPAPIEIMRQALIEAARGKPR